MEREFIPIPTMNLKANSRMTRWNPGIFYLQNESTTPSTENGRRQVRESSSFQTDENSLENSRMSFRPTNKPSSQPKTRCLKKTKTGVNSIRWFPAFSKSQGTDLKTFCKYKESFKSSDTDPHRGDLQESI